MESTVLYSVDNDIATVTLNRPGSRNALEPATLGLMKEVIEQAGGDKDIRVIVLNGNGDGFCSGADLAVTTGFASAEQVIEEHYKPCFVAIAELEKPVIGSIQGAAAGAGCALALLCDLVVMSKDAYLLLAFSNLVLIPDCGANWLLPRAIGYQRAYQLAIEGGKLSADECFGLGIANKVVERDELNIETIKWATELAKRAPMSMGLTKRLMRDSFASTYADVFSEEGRLQKDCMASADFAEGIGAFFDNRTPVFKGN